jgi:hypothetical protein
MSKQRQPTERSILMHNEHNPLAHSGQEPIDFLAAQLANGRAPTLDIILKMFRDEPLGPPEGEIMVRVRGAGWCVGQRQRWPKSVLDRRARFPGYQPGHRFREMMKYGRCPPPDAPLRAQIRQVLDHARAKWSGAIDAGTTKKQFRDWLPEYLDDDSLCWRIDQLASALQILRLACGLPRFAATKNSEHRR